MNDWMLMVLKRRRRKKKWKTKQKTCTYDSADRIKYDCEYIFAESFELGTERIIKLFISESGKEIETKWKLVFDVFG